MSILQRFGISVNKALLDQFDVHIRLKGYKTRSEAIRDLMRKELVVDEWTRDETVAGSLTVIYNHHTRKLQEKITIQQHDYNKNIISSQHIHLDNHNCMEIIAIKGKARILRQLANDVGSLKGVKHYSLNMTTTGDKI